MKKITKYVFAIVLYLIAFFIISILYNRVVSYLVSDFSNSYYINLSVEAFLFCVPFYIINRYILRAKAKTSILISIFLTIFSMWFLDYIETQIMKAVFSEIFKK